ncbi:MAG: hypothetical protein A2X83_06075 [Desulfuromonadales bacterium GWD2_54_10]|nr:MAG: hypothetical protein A2X83_06075 [Desulfuromonadales bacterium GWD2_54_10]
MNQLKINEQAVHKQNTTQGKLCLSLGILSLFFGILTGVPAVISGHMALKQIKESPTILAGKGIVYTGLVLGYLAIALSSLFIILFLYSGFRF